MDRMRIRCTALMLALTLASAGRAAGQERLLDGEMHHLRAGNRPEWAAFPPTAEGEQLVLRFAVRANAAEQTLRLRQSDVKQAWHVLLNENALGMLRRDENDMIVYFPIPPGVLRSGENTLRIEPADPASDDIRVGAIALEDRPVEEVLSEAVLQLEVADGETGALLPARITVARAGGVLQTVGGASDEHLAARPGFVYTGNGRATFGLPAGTYTVYAGRGFEYGVDSTRLVLRPGDRARHRFVLRREVPTEGWISADTHIHTLTYSGHGDATAEERVLTITGEGLELPVLTEHNRHVDLEPIAEAMGVRAYFTPVVGNEVTTGVGHFNIFPVTAQTPVPEHEGQDWDAVFRSLGAVPGDPAVILNHARDLHSGFRPFGPDRHLAAAGENLDGWVLRADAMEVINSSAQQSDMMRLFHDWFGMLNRGHFLTPVGSSDSHDVGRRLVGQARTYIRGRDDDPGRIDVPEVVAHFRQGRVMVSFGLLAELTVDGTYGPGELVPASGTVAVSVRVLGPGWVRADRVALYANGQKIREATIAEGDAAGVKWSGIWTLPRPAHDVFLVAVAEGPGASVPFWPISKPYQPTSPEWHPHVIGSSGAVWIDADGDGQRTSAYRYAEERVAASQGDVRALLRSLVSYDEAVAVQAAALLHEQGRPLTEPEVVEALQEAVPQVQRGFERFLEAQEAARRARKAP